VLNAVARYNERGFTLAKSKSKDRIDAAVAMIMALFEASRPEETYAPSVSFF
jgi:phage terminase large subunit-like protein